MQNIIDNKRAAKEPTLFNVCIICILSQFDIIQTKFDSTLMKEDGRWMENVESGKNSIA